MSDTPPTKRLKAGPRAATAAPVPVGVGGTAGQSGSRAHPEKRAALVMLDKLGDTAADVKMDALPSAVGGPRLLSSEAKIWAQLAVRDRDDSKLIVRRPPHPLPVLRRGTSCIFVMLLLWGAGPAVLAQA